MNDAHIIACTRSWVETIVVGLNLCPFAKRELVRERIRFSVANATTAEGILSELAGELERITADEDIGTTLLILPRGLADFGDYLDLLEAANTMLAAKELEGDIQIASFHPDYQFAGTTADDVSNYTNRSPFPILHLLREDDITWATENHPDIDGIPERNIRLMQELGMEHLKKLLGRA